MHGTVGGGDLEVKRQSHQWALDIETSGVFSGRVKGFEHLAIVPRLCQDSATVTDLVRVTSPGPQDKTTVLGLGVADR